jgi:hypothetical protein
VAIGSKAIGRNSAHTVEVGFVLLATMSIWQFSKYIVTFTGNYSGSREMIYYLLEIRTLFGGHWVIDGEPLPLAIPAHLTQKFIEEFECGSKRRLRRINSLENFDFIHAISLIGGFWSGKLLTIDGEEVL